MLRFEAETTLNFNEEEQIAQIWSASSTFQRKMERSGIAPLKATKRPDGGVNCWYEVPKKWVKVSKPRVMTEEQRLANVERGKALAAMQAEKRHKDGFVYEETGEQ